jgi:hypothetical protein
MGTFDDNRRTLGIDDRIPPRGVRVDPPAADIGLRRNVERFPFVPSDPHGCNRIATRPTASRSPGWSSGCGP